jgi:hypothetical protein
MSYKSSRQVPRCSRNEDFLPVRTPWRPGFPVVIAQAPYGDMRGHVTYHAAKTGLDNEAALALVYYCIRDVQVKKIKKELVGSGPRIVPVHSEEAKGRNKIPMAYAEVLATILDLDTDPGNESADQGSSEPAALVNKPSHES